MPIKGMFTKTIFLFISVGCAHVAYGGPNMNLGGAYGHWEEGENYPACEQFHRKNFDCSNDNAYCNPLKACACYRRNDDGIKDAVYVDCSDLGISSVPRGLPPKTDILYLNDNNIQHISKTDINEAFSLGGGGGKKLKVLYLHNNRELNNIDDNAFETLSALRELYLHYTHLTNFGNGILRGLSSLKVLWINHANIRTIGQSPFHGLTKLEELLLYHNKIEKLQPNMFKDLESLQVLEIQDQCLKDWCEFESYPSSDINCCTMCGLPKSTSVLVEMTKGSKLRCGCSEGDDISQCPECYEQCTVFKYGSEEEQIWMDDIQKIRLTKKLVASG